MIRILIKFIRILLGNSIVFANYCFPAKQIKRSTEKQARATLLASTLSLYQFHLCPFCVKVRRMIRALNIDIALKDVNKNQVYEEELIQGGGKRKVPCLRIQEKGQDTWLYESNEINTYLKRIFS
eukprot:COSAG01_NODE_2312_length_7938_cov_4.108687_6_plen_125_part_00